MHSYDDYRQILGDTTPMARNTIASIAALLGGPGSEASSPRTWAARRLGSQSAELAAVAHHTSSTGIAVLGYVLGFLMDKYDCTDVGGPGDDDPPTWAPLQLGSNDKVVVPSRLTVHFPAGTLASVPVCIAIDDDEFCRSLQIFTLNEHRAEGRDVMANLLEVSRTRNPFRGHVLEAKVGSNNLMTSITSTSPSPRSSLVLPAALWTEVDIFIAAATHRRDDMQALGLGTNRGLLLAGPPGTGKTHLSRVIATELAGEFTVIVADAASIRRYISTIYDEAEVLGPLVVILEDIDLLIGHRKDGAADTLADFLNALDGVNQRHAVFTIATTNDPSAIDPAAQRTARFDTILTLPLPGRPERQGILDAYLKPLGLDLDLSSTAALLDGCTGSDVREVVRRAVLEHGRSFGTDDLNDIARSGRWRPKPSTGQYL